MKGESFGFAKQGDVLRSGFPLQSLRDAKDFRCNPSCKLQNHFCESGERIYLYCVKTKCFLLFLFCISFRYEIYSQWILQNSGTTKWLFESYFLNNDTGFVVGDYGLVLKTKDGGSTWTQQFTPNTSVYLLCTHFPTKQVGYIGGQDGYIAKTTDGGMTFSNVTIVPGMNNIESIFFFNKDSGLASTSTEIYKTFDGGNSWQNVSAFPWGARDIYFTNDSVGYAVYSGVLKTTDRGNTWIILDTLTGYDPTSLVFLNSDTGYITTKDPAILKTVDGGFNWTNINIPASTSAYQLFSIYFTSQNNGFAVGGMNNTKGTILSTKDGGNTWSIQLDDTLNQFSSIYFPSDSIGYITSMGGDILKTTTGGFNSVVQLSAQNNFCIYPNPTIRYIHNPIHR